MANTQVSTLFRTYTLSVRARAGLQILNHAIYHIAGEHRDETELLTRLDAGALMWEARERILKAAAGRRMPHLRRLYREAMQTGWRNPVGGGDNRLLAARR